MYYQFNTYIDDKDMIMPLLDYGWMCFGNGTWTNCPYEIYKSIKKAHTGDYVDSKIIRRHLQKSRL
tara:strand:+ start:483 stop:680 length:198 start_codon:yes stop_codon:yes gene_type:complete